MLVRNHRGNPGEMSNGQVAWTALKEKYDIRTKETRRASHEQLVNSRIKRGEDPDDYFSRSNELRIRLDEIGESVADAHFAHIFLNGITDQYKWVSEAAFIDRTFNIDGMITAVRNAYIEAKIPKNWGQYCRPRLAMSAVKSRSNTKDAQCYHCGKTGHFKNRSPERKKVGMKGAMQTGRWRDPRRNGAHTIILPPTVTRCAKGRERSLPVVGSSKRITST